MPESLRAFDLGTGLKWEVSQHCIPSVDSLNKTTMQLFKTSLCSPNSNVASGFVCSLGGGCHLGFRAIVLIEEADIGKKKKRERNPESLWSGDFLPGLAVVS